MLRQSGLEDETLHMLLQILTPFIIYLIAEHLGVSGILAAVAGGLVHAIEKERIAISMPGLKRASDPTWSVLMFYYSSFQSFFTIASAIIIYGVLLLLRFVWSLAYSLVRKWLAKGLPSFRTLALSTISGADSAVTLAGAFSTQGEEIKVRIQALNIERNHILARMEVGAITKEQANIYYRMLDNLERTLTTQTSFVKWLVLICKQLLQQFKMFLH